MKQKIIFCNKRVRAGRNFKFFRKVMYDMAIAQLFRLTVLARDFIHACKRCVIGIKLPITD